MISIPPKIYARLLEALPRCGPFSTDAEIRAVFADGRLAQWRDSLPQANNLKSRVELLINYLGEQYNASRENALVLLLYVLGERILPSDNCHHELAELASEFEALSTKTQDKLKTKSARIPAHENIVLAESAYDDCRLLEIVPNEVTNFV